MNFVDCYYTIIIPRLHVCYIKNCNPQKLYLLKPQVPGPLLSRYTVFFLDISFGEQLVVAVCSPNFVYSEYGPLTVQVM